MLNGTHQTDLHLLPTNDQPPFCISCISPLNIFSLLALNLMISAKYFTAKTVKELFSDTSSDSHQFSSGNQPF